RKILNLGTAIHKMTLMPARRYKIEKRGALIPGWHGDVTVLDPERLKDNATFENPKQLSTGTELVFVGGAAAWEKGVPGRKNGKVLSPAKPDAAISPLFPKPCR
ncbi:MAG: hypothetical protein LBR47_06330, partial [Spirochaetaceae bacterium]|nr:hypothetical protein [Spirochaetaceae bacterium]